MPNFEEARLLADVRRRVAEAVGIEVEYLDAGSIQDRYTALLDTQRQAAH